ncbi:hypothetical protein [Oculatella sp. LEGE 06141]|uniref:hypothetical protein n=1 Tax=Oculatella sp. LEGE 06141 TaxID=1828648 RepID=UPI001880CD00|nr:hypothetical protein [Oculatella sp. LEGE 06141]
MLPPLTTGDRPPHRDNDLKRLCSTVYSHPESAMPHTNPEVKQQEEKREKMTLRTEIVKIA